MLSFGLRSYRLLFFGMTVQICNISDIMQVPEKTNSLNFVIKF